MNKPTPIPTPPALRWREIRIRFLPPVVFACGICLSAWIWTHQLAAPTLVGEVETVRANVTSSRPGIITQLNVERFGTVRAGDTVAEVMVCDPRYLETTLGVVKAEAAVLRLQLDPVRNVERARIDYLRLRLEVLDQNVQLGSARIKLRYAEAEYERVAKLHSSGLNSVASQADLDAALRDRDELRDEVATREQLIRDLEGSMAALKLASPSAPGPEDPPSAWQATLDLQEQRIKQTLAEFNPVPLRAPVDGTVSTIYRQSGETVNAGEPIATITSARSDRIVAYLLPPWREPVRVGMEVEVRSRSGNRPAARSRIVEVASHMDWVMPTLSVPNSSQGRTLMDQGLLAAGGNGGPPRQAGLPFAIRIPEGLGLLPGEVVDLRLVQPLFVQTDTRAHARN